MIYDDNDSYDDYDVKPTEEDIIKNSRPNYIYSHGFGKGRYFQVVSLDEEGFEIKLTSRTMFKVLYIKDKEDIVRFEIIKLTKQSDNSDFQEKQKVTLSKFGFAQLISFIKFISEIDLKGISERRIQLSDQELESLDGDTKKKIVTLLSKEDGKAIVEELIKDGLITSKDIVNTSYRKEQLDIFKKLLSEDGYLQSYKSQIGKENTKDEIAWQYFFQKNDWIFGYGLDYRFQGILQKEFHASSSDADGSGEVISDFLLGDSNFATFVELKKPDTHLFGREQNRSNAWRLSNDIIDAVSQILEQKSSGQIKMETQSLHNDDGERIEQKSYDSKVILIIGHWNQIDGCSDKEKEIKKKTFELFRRDSRNIEIITYDELYDRAKFIIEHSSDS